MAFLVDFCNVSPLQLTNSILEILESFLIQCDLKIFVRATILFNESITKSTLMLVISKRLSNLSIQSHISLGFLLYIFDQKLILLDTAINSGLIKLSYIQNIPYFSKQSPKIVPKNHLFQDLAFILQRRDSLLPFTLCLHLFERLSNNPPNIIFSVKKYILDELIQSNSLSLLLIISGKPIPRQRTDIEYILSYNSNNILNKDLLNLYQLAEIENSLSNWNKKKFIWFECSKINDNLNEIYNTIDGESLILNSNELILSNGLILNLWKIQLINENKNKKQIIIKENSNQYIFEFSNLNISSNFELDLISKQLLLFHETLKKLY